MARRSVTSVSTLLVAIMVHGCATERPVEPPPLVEMPAMELSIEPVKEITQWIEPVQTTSDNEFMFYLDNAEQLRRGYYDQVYLTYESWLCSGTFEMLVLNPETRTWEQIEWYRRPMNVSCAWITHEPFPYYRFLSSGASMPVADYIDENGFISIRCDSVFAMKMSLIRFSNSYVSKAVGALSPSYGGSLTSDGNNLYVDQRCVDEGGNWFDSAYVLDKSGARVSQHATPNYRTAGACFDDQGRFWKWSPSTDRLIAFDPAGNAIDSISVADPVRSAISWHDERIWFFTGVVKLDELRAINVAASLDSGYAVIDRRYNMPIHDVFLSDHVAGFCIEENVIYVNSTGQLHRLNFLGDILESYATPVSLLSALVLDDGTVWVLHIGPAGLTKWQSNELFLSRLRLP